MLDLKKLLDGTVPSVEFSLSESECDFIEDSSDCSFTANGIVTNSSGVIVLDGEIKPELKVTCARCGKEINYSEPIKLQAKITDKLANEDDEEFVLLQDFALDIDELVRTALILEMPSRFLCVEDCKGLCPKCGCDLNEGSCNCDLKDRDPRWDVLKDYFSD